MENNEIIDALEDETIGHPEWLDHELESSFNRESIIIWDEDEGNRFCDNYTIVDDRTFVTQVYPANHLGNK